MIYINMRNKKKLKDKISVILINNISRWKSKDKISEKEFYRLRDELFKLLCAMQKESQK
jgi:hypothetical protein